MTIGEILAVNAANFPGKIALIMGEERLNFREMNAASNRMANALIREGIGEGVRVAVLEKTTPRAIQMIFGVAKSGATLVMVNNLLRPRELEFILQDCEPSYLFVGEGFEDQILSLRPKLSSLRKLISLGEGEKGILSFAEWIEGASSAPPDRKVQEGALFNLLYTAGTTGVPKAALYSHSRFWQNLLSTVIDTPGMGYNDIWLGPVPLYHIGGFATLIRAFLMSNTVILRDSFDPVAFLQTIEKEKATILYAYPTMIHALVNHPEAEKFDLSSLRLVVYGGSAMPLATLHKAFEVFRCNFLQRYGSTECCGAGISVLTPEDHRRAMGGDEKARQLLASAGRATVGTVIKIVEESGKEITEPDIPGEIVARLNAPMEEYWKRPEDSRETLKDGWLYTGDIGKKDREGFLYIIDRKKDVIISGARNIYPREIEEVLHSHPAILEAAVIGVPDEYWVESVKAFLVLRPGKKTTEEGIIAFCKENMASYKKPRFVEFVPSLPKNPGGKIDKKELKRQSARPK
ncbi:MAG: long-chain-fatty-acid--CoA ligase [Deltaproteobacteria bacterium]|nr:long-chain-fatty-acid--CoA ligase [Deltaproteobacteria bacterium]